MKAERAASVAKKEANEEIRDFFKDKRRKLEQGCDNCSGSAAADVDAITGSFDVPVVVAPAEDQVTFVTGNDGTVYKIPSELLKKNI